MLSNFNYYGFTIGLAAVLAVWLWEKHAAKLKIKFIHPNLNWLIVLLLMTIGARVWHVLTDWSLYINDWWQALAIWQGGLSILGALVGLVLALIVVAKKEGLKLLVLLDLAALSLPWAQAIGRFGNYFNGELYGWPTNLPWAIVVGGQNVHPLFLYESLLLLILAVFFELNFRVRQLKSGQYFFIYLNYYLVVRFLLDFLRVQKTMLNQWLGVNQFIILLLLIMILLMNFYKKFYVKKY